MTVIEEIHIPGFEKVIEAKNPSLGLHAFIALHNTTLGPALGGTRIYSYPTKEAALTDVLRLAQGMTYKSALTKVGFGGGKAVIIGDHKKIKSQEFLFAYADVINSLGGNYITAEDIGTTTDDVAIMRQRTPYVVGLPFGQGLGSGDPSPFTAWGVYRGIQAVAAFLFGSPSLAGKKIAIQGIGKVGKPLAEFLFWNGAKLVVADMDPAALTQVSKLYGAEIVPPSEIHKVPCDIFAPCAMGGILNDVTIPEMQCKAVAGSANNQLLSEHHADVMKKHGILYAPDYVINAGGLINVCHELLPGGYDATSSRILTDKIEDSLLKLFQKAEEDNLTPSQEAINLAHLYLDQKIGKREIPLRLAL
jgi:leucine dehydrogenase